MGYATLNLRVDQINSVLRLQPTKVSLTEAMALFRNGAVDECLENLIGSVEHDAVILGIRCYIRAGRLAEAESAIEAYWRAINRSGSDRERGETAMLRASVASKLGRRIIALAAFGEARGYLLGAGSNRLTAELENHQAMLALNEGDLDTATLCAEVGLELGELNERIAARSILAVVEATRGDFRSQLELYLQSAEELAEVSGQDFQFAATIENVAILAQQQDRLDLYEKLVSFAERISWVSNTKRFESGIYRELGLLSSRFGDHLTAFRFLRRSAEVAPSQLQRLEAVLDGAIVAREIGETFASADRVSNAVELADNIDWTQMSQAQRLALFTLAEEQSRIDPVAARNTLSKVGKLNRRESTNIGPAVDLRFQAVSIRAHGIVAKAEGNVGLAGSCLQQAFDYWKSIGFGWIAATTALELFDLTHDPAYINFVENYLTKTRSAHLERKLVAARASIAELAS